jgi:glycosyltransferase involved in cell wall biosynthesis
MRILTNFDGLPARWSVPGGPAGTARTVHQPRDFLQSCRECDLILVNNDAALVLRLAAWFTVLPFLRKPLVAVDLVLRRPRNEAVRRLKKLLFSRVDYFIHYFKDLTDYDRFYGIGPDRSCFVPFKPNILRRHETPACQEGDYILCFGRSLRDYDTFFDAVAQVPYPAAIPRPDFAQLRKHGSQFTRSLSELPPNVRVLDDDGSEESLVRVLRGARLVVLPIRRESLLAGISTYLNAMLVRKCVIVSEGPGVSDVLHDQALFVPPEDPAALAGLIRRAWEDGQLRESTAELGYRYALSLGGESEFHQRIIDCVAGWHAAAHQAAGE